MIRNVFSLLILANLFVAGMTDALARSSTDDRQIGILWQIERQGTRPSFLFGTVHSDDPRVIDLPVEVRKKFHEAGSFTAELKLDSHSSQEASRLMFLPGGQKLESLIGDERYRQCVKLLAKYGIMEQQVRHMKPWAISVILGMPKPRSGMVLDELLYHEAESKGKMTYGLETNREQVAVFESFSLQEQIIMLDDALREFSHLSAVFDEVLHYYLQRDLSGLERISDKYMLKGNSPLARNLKQRILLDRNHLMVRRMKPRLMEGNSFIAVGALHLPGEEGILRLLEKEGYRVTPVY